MIQQYYFGLPYNDISPQRAFEIVENDEVDFMVLDVSNETFLTRIPNSKKNSVRTIKVSILRNYRS